MTSRAVFLDRDGVINENIYYEDTEQWEAPRRLRDFRFAAGAIGALRQLRRCGFHLILVSNQPNIALGKASWRDHTAIHRALRSALHSAGLDFLQFCYCFHHPRGVVSPLAARCQCRKPSPFWIQQSALRFGIHLKSSWMVGDRATDTACAFAAGVRAVRIGRPSQPDANATLVAVDLADAVDQLLGFQSRRMDS